MTFEFQIPLTKLKTGFYRSKLCFGTVFESFFVCGVNLHQMGPWGDVWFVKVKHFQNISRSSALFNQVSQLKPIVYLQQQPDIEPGTVRFFFTRGRKQPDDVFHFSPLPYCHCAGNSAGLELWPKHVLAPTGYYDEVRQHLEWENVTLIMLTCSSLTQHDRKKKSQADSGVCLCEP